MVHISPILPHSPFQSAMYDDSIYTQIETAKPLSDILRSIPNVHRMNSSIPELIRCKFDADFRMHIHNCIW